MPFRAALNQLKDRLDTYIDLNLASNVLSWDQATYAPQGGGPQRSRQLSTLGRLSQDLLTDSQTGKLIDQLMGPIDEGHLEANDAALVREAKRMRDVYVKVPSSLHAEMLETQSRLYNIWTTAKPRSDFAAVKPLLEKSVEQSRRFADCFSNAVHPMDAMIDLQDPGFTAEQISTLFSSLRAELVPLLKHVAAKPPVDDSCLQGNFPEAQQLEFCRQMAKDLGYDFKRGRLDLSPHPFMIRFAGDDIRITTRVNTSSFGGCFFGVVHETGHALYELGIDPAFDGTLLGTGVSNGIHESQSRLWENCVARSQSYWTYAYPVLQDYFPHFKTVPVKTFLAAVNRVRPGLTRVEADELTYNLHVMIRFDCEMKLLDGSLKVSDLPEYWNERYSSDLGVRPSSEAEGCMQDIHWYSFRIGGAFQGYTIGNILSVQFYEAAKRATPDLEREISRGNFAPLRLWLKENLHRYGASKRPHELINAATGSELTTTPYVQYLKSKYASV